MIIVNLIYNLAALVALTVVSGIIDTRYNKKTLTGRILQGLLYASAAIVGMLYPFVLVQGVIFDGRSIIISICTLFFGPLAGVVTSVLSTIARIWIGGSGALTGSLVITASFLIGYIFYALIENSYLKLSKLILYIFGLVTSTVMMILMLTLPASFINDVFSIITLSVMVFYPIMTLISGKVLLDHQEKREYLKLLNHEKTLYFTTLYSIGDGVISTDEFGNVVTLNPTAEKLTGWTEKEAAGKQLDEIFVIINEFTRNKVENPVTKVLREEKTIGLANHTLLISNTGKEIPISDSGAPIKDENGKITGVVLVFNDQTEERNARRRIEDSEFRLKRAELASKSGNWELHLSEQKIIGSEGARVIYGVESTEFDYEYIRNIPLPEYRPLLDTALRNLIEKDEPYDLQFKIKCPDTGQIKDIKSTAFYNKKKKILFGVMQDITKQKHTEDALRESEKHYRELFMVNPHPMWVYDIETLKFLMVNDSAVAHYGYTSDEFLSKKISDIRPPEDAERLKENVSRVTEGIDRAGLWRHCKKDGTIILVDIISHAMMFNGRKSEMVLALNVTDRVLAQEALRESEQKFRTLIEHSSDAFYLICNDKLEMINSRFTELTGYTFEETQDPDFTFWDLITPGSIQIIHQRIESRKQGNELQPVYEITLVSKDRKEIECEIGVSYIDYKGGVAVQGVIRNITQRKQAEHALKESTRNLNATLNATADGILAVGLNKQVLFSNERFAELWKIPGNILNNRDDSIILQFVLQQLADPDSFIKEVQRLYDSKENSFDTIYFKDGRVFERYSFPLMYEMSLPLGRVWSFRDITERKKAEENLRESERNFRLLFENSPLGIYTALPDGTIIKANQALLDILDSPSIEVTRKINILNFPPLIETGYAENFRKCVDVGEVIEMELTYTSKWGKKSFLVSYFIPLKGTDGRLEKVYSIINDITERKSLEVQIKQSELKFRTITDFTYDWEYWSGPDNSLIYISPSCQRITGYSCEEFYKNPSLIQEIIYPDDLEAWNKSISAIESKTIFKCDLRIICKNEQLKWINHICNAIFAEDGTYLGRRASNRDITERKQAEDSLLKLKKAVDTSGDAIFLTNTEGTFTYINPAFTNLYGYSSSDVVGKVTPRILKSGLLDHNIYEQFWETLTYGNDVKGELINKRKSGEYVDIEGSASPILDEDKKIIGFLGIQRNISERKKAQIALQESEEKFRNIFTNHSAIKLLLDPENGNIVEANSSAAKFYNWTIGELENMNISQINTLPLDEIKKEMKKTKNKQQSYFEFKHRKADGTIRDVEVYSSNVVIGGKDYLHSIIHDITEKKHTEQLLKENEEKMRLLVEGTSYFFFYTHNKQGEVTYVSPSVERITGYKVEEWIGQSHWFLTDSPLNSIARERTRRALAGEVIKEPINLEIYNRSGEPILLEIYEVPLIKEGRLIGLQGIAHDITERNRLLQNIKKLSSAVEQSPVSIVITDIDGNIEYINPKFTEVTGFTDVGAVGQNLRLLKSGKHTKGFYSHLWGTILSGKNWSGVFHNKRKNGELFWESAIISPIKNEEGIITNFVAVKEDITQKIEKEIELSRYRQHLESLVEERTEELDQLNRDLLNQLQKEKELEEQLNAALSKEKEVNELKTRFIATVSHEFRTPLASLLSSSQMIQRYSKKWSEEKLTDHYKRISSTINYLTRLLDDVLTISRTDREVLTNNPELVDIEELLKSYLEEIKPIITPEHEIIFTNKCENKKIFLDYKLFRQVMVNLLTNAVKYSPGGGKIELDACIENDRVHVGVSDQGLGIPMDEIQYIFEPFYRSKNSLGIQGTGLGLNIVKRCTEIMGGEVYLNSILNQGTSFKIIIPIAYEK